MTLYEYFDRNDLLTQHQYGFRKNHSTEFAAMELIAVEKTKPAL